VERIDHVVDVCGAETLEQSLKAVQDEGIISVVGVLPIIWVELFRYSLGQLLL
jgi:NADPH:quinone reductase-like Zn-dependent oxidoreductase